MLRRRVLNRSGSHATARGHDPVRPGSWRAAGCTSPATDQAGDIAQHLRELEEAVGVPLLSRTTRRVTMTDEGSRYYANSVQMRVNVWDFFMVFGTLQQQTETQVEIRNFQGIYLSPQQAKALLGLLQQNIAGYEGAFKRKRELAAEVVRLKLPLTVNAVMHRANIDRVGDMVDLALALGAGRFDPKRNPALKRAM